MQIGDIVGGAMHPIVYFYVDVHWQNQLLLFLHGALFLCCPTYSGGHQNCS